jgi:pyrroloquinoline-quinone synthase
MSTQEFFEQLDARIAKFDLLCHPFYQAWSAGKLTREDLREYARDYYHQVEAFPCYLAEFGLRLGESELRRTVLANMQDELGSETGTGECDRSHAELWLDFVEGMGAQREMLGHEPLSEIKELTSHFHQVAAEAIPEEALATFYTYESQVPRVAKEKARGLREIYGADEKTCRYFTLHTTADVFHSEVWRQQLAKRVETNPETAERALNAAEATAKALWHALDGIEAKRLAQAA